MMSFIHNGQARPDYHNASCGGHFNQYVKHFRTSDFPYCHYTGGSEEHTDLWSGRTLKLKLHKDAPHWRMAKVESFLEWLTGPYCPEANWTITVRFTDVKDGEGNPPVSFAIGDIVEIHGLQGAKQHNGKEAAVASFVEETGRYCVQYKDTKRRHQTIGVKPCNLKHVEVMEFDVCRCNVEGGGTLNLKIDHLGRGSKHLISFEWLEEATPQLKMNGDCWCVTCPTCRAVTKSFDTVNGDHLVDHLVGMECPICMEAKNCMPIGTCGHFICRDCCNALKTKPDGSFFFHLEKVQVNISPEKLNKKRDAMFHCCNAPPTNDEVMRHLGEAFPDTPDDDDLDELVALKEWFLVHPLHLWIGLPVLQKIVGMFELNAAEILAEYVESLRGTDLFNRFVQLSKALYTQKGICIAGIDANRERHLMLLNDPDQYHNLIMLNLTEWMGLKYEEVGDYRRAIGWYEKNIVYPTKMVVFGYLPTAMRSSLSNLGLAQKKDGMFESAKRNYDEALTYAYGPEVRLNIMGLQNELEQWTGTGGTTPRMDE